MVLWGFAVWVEVSEYFKKLSVFNNGEWAMAVGEPQCNFHVVAHFGIL